jgi:hypothetical protein
MLKIKSQPYNSVWILADTQEELNRTFMRFTEYYESPNPLFKDQIFTVGQLKSWYSTTYGADTYHIDWSGFNIPSKVLKPFRDGLFDPLTSEEQNLLDLFKYRHDSFYIIGAQNNSVLRHELAHALYSHNINYKTKVDALCSKFKKELSKTSKYIIDKGYHKDVLQDELQAYITDNDDEFIIKNTPQHIINKFNKLYEDHK